MSQTESKMENSRSIWSTVIGGLGLILVFFVGGSFADSDWDWARSIAPTIIWLGIALQLFYFFLFVGNSKLVKLLGGQLASQVFLSVLIWLLYTQASVHATSMINEVFGISGSAFPLSHQVLTFVSLFIIGKPLFGVLTIWGGLALLYYMASGGDGTHRSVQTLIFSASGLVIGFFSLALIHIKLDDDLLSKKAYLIAHSLDFNSSLNCPGHDLKGNGIFLGPAQSRVLFDSSNQTMSWDQALYANKQQLKDINIPSKLEIYECVTTKK
jgi:hypothetical protein